MQAEIINGSSISGKRELLAKKIPLETPYIVQIFPVYGCNFKCNYCIHSLEPSKRGYISSSKFMDFELYKKCIDDISNFPHKIKMLRFGATGEPLLHNKIAQMVEYASKKNVADSIDIVTNGALLTKVLSENLVNSGLSWLRISIQGLSSQKYKDISSVDINYEKFIENLTYFYKIKKDTKVYIKIIDIALEHGEEEYFYNIFGNICDKISVEHLLPAVSNIDYTKISDANFDFTQNGNCFKEVEVCPQPFYMMQINPDGNIVPCCSMETAFVVGNCENKSLLDIWNGSLYKDFQILMLKKEKNINPVCNSCQSYKYNIFKEDMLDEEAENLLKLINGV